MKSCYIELYIYAGIPFFYHIPYVFNKKINTGNFKKIPVPKSPNISFSALKVGKKALMFFFQLKDLENIRPEEPAILCVCVFFFFVFL